MPENYPSLGISWCATRKGLDEGVVKCNLKSHSTGAQYVTLDNKTERPFGNPTNKTVTGIAYTWELLIANNLDPSV
jgi:hypothetical protein